jgi:hypothetical protein
VALRAPTRPTLRRYGLTLEDWRRIATAQRGVCFVCRQLPKSERLHIDHEHVKDWKKMPPEKRKKHVRGLLCFRCNTTYVGRSITVERARNVVTYLERYEEKAA